MKKKFKLPILLLIITLIFFVSCTLSNNGSNQEKNNNSTQLQKAPAVKGFYIQNGKLYDANDNLFIMRGVNHPHCWYKSTLNASITAQAIKGANAVRVVLSDGTHPDYGANSKTSAAELREIIDLCKARQIIAVLEVHDATGSNEVTRLNNAVNFWIDMKNELIGEEAHVIINIANEWYGQWQSQGWADGYIQAIPQLRTAGLNHTLLIDCAGYGQYPQSIFDQGQAVFNADPQANTMFAIHMYEYSGGTPATVQSNIDNTLALGLALCIGEFGHQHSGGDVAEQEVLDYCELKQVGWLAWSWKGNSGGVEYLDISNDWDGNSLTTWGDTVFNGTNGISTTSTVCSVFGNAQNNFAPDVNAGPDKEVKVLSTIASATVSDDGRPANGTLTVTWSKVSGPGTVAFSDAASSTTNVTFSDYGVYVLQITANDGDKSASDTVQITATQGTVTYKAVPGTIEVEDYDEYFDTTPGNAGGAYRQDDVDIEACNEGGYAIGYTDAGEWLRFYVDVAQAGNYDIQVRVSSAETGKQLHLDMDGTDITGPMTVPNTGGWQSFQTITKENVTLAAGKQYLTLFMDTDLFNINWIKIVSQNSSSSSSSSSSTSSTSSSSSSVSSSSSSTSSSSSHSGEGVTATYSISDDWGSGFVCNVTINNNNNTALTSWELEWTYIGNQSISNAWNADLVQTGKKVVVKNLPYTSVPANGSYSFGFQASYSGTNDIPVIIVNGQQQSSSSSSSVSSSSSSVSSSSSSSVSSSSSSTTSSSSSSVSSSSSSTTSSSSSSVSSSSSSSSSSTGTYVTITAPFVKDGSGEFYYKTDNIPGYVNSWNLQLLEINGVDLTNVYKGKNDLPAKQDGFYYIHYKSQYSWGHLEVK